MSHSALFVYPVRFPIRSSDQNQHNQKDSGYSRAFFLLFIGTSSYHNFSASIHIFCNTANRTIFTHFFYQPFIFWVAPHASPFEMQCLFLKYKTSSNNRYLPFPFIINSFSKASCPAIASTYPLRSAANISSVVAKQFTCFTSGNAESIV